MPADRRPPANLVFLVDVSGSMGSNYKLSRLKTAAKDFVTAEDFRDEVLASDPPPGPDDNSEIYQGGMFVLED